MAVMAVIDRNSNEQVNLIVAEPGDVPPDGCYLVEIPPGYRWDQQTGSAVPAEVLVDGN